MDYYYYYTVTLFFSYKQNKQTNKTTMPLLSHFFNSCLFPPLTTQPSRSFCCSCSISPPRQHQKMKRKVNSKSSSSVAILWYKHDLRVDDHPALSLSSTCPSLLPLYVFDPRFLSRYSEEMLELLIYALEDLRNSLQELGSNLMIRFGNAEGVIRDLVVEVKATDVFGEVEIEYHLRHVVQLVEETLLREPLLGRNVKLTMWQTPFYDVKNLKDLPDSYGDFEKLRLPISSCISAPMLPKAEIGMDWGPLPSLDDLKNFIHETPFKSKESWTSIKKMSIETVLLQKKLSNSRKNLNSTYVPRKRPSESSFVTREGNVVGGGTSHVLNGLAAYLRYLEGTARDDWQELHEKLRNAESRDGASFFSLFGPALCLGIISRRRAYNDALKYEKERNAGFLSPFGYSTTSVAAVADAVCSMEWYWLIALKCQESNRGACSTRFWRWNGHLIQYIMVGSEGPAVLLVHGFGAFLEHYRDNIRGISEGGNQVWAISLLGFGRSEKPNVVYTEIMWAELLRDFIVEVVGEPVHLVGNSVGGYIVSLVACFWPALTKSVVLINSAGDVIPDYSYLQLNKERQTPGPAWLGARLLLFYLRSNIGSVVKNCYPTKPERADEWLINEMIRASYDPNVVVVLESVFSFNLSLPLNYLLKGFEDKVLVIQGMKDPISNSKTKVAMLNEHCRGVVIKQLNAGHCPHDEKPEEVNSIICEWTTTVESKLVAQMQIIP